MSKSHKETQLEEIWHQVVYRIFDKMFEMSGVDLSTLHQDLYEEVVFELAKLDIHLKEQIKKRRLADRQIDDVDLDKERDECLGPSGTAIIDGTAKMLSEHVWLKLYKERWEPKTKAAQEREKNPKKKVLSVKPVKDNHYIPKWYIRDYWAQAGRIRRLKRDAELQWEEKFAGAGNWGYLPGLYTDKLEAYFSLLEGDAKKPLRKLLDIIPINWPERQSLIGFFVIQVLRNPAFMNRVRVRISPVVSELVGAEQSEDDTYMRDVHETLFGNNDFYDRFVRPLHENAWVLIKSDEPCFVLPDVFCCVDAFEEETHLLVPISPTACFATIPVREDVKRIVPINIKASPAFAWRIVNLLAKSSQSEFLAHHDFDTDKLDPRANDSLEEILSELTSTCEGKH